jgi:hypothetical protein
VGAEHGAGAVLGLPEQPGDLLVDDPLGLLGVGLAEQVLGALAEVVGSAGGIADRPGAGARPRLRSAREGVRAVSPPPADCTASAAGPAAEQEQSTRAGSRAGRRPR